jgi:hypothetical protein
VQRFVGATLIFDVVSDGGLVAVLIHGVGVEATGPKVSAPEYFFDFRMVKEDFSGCDTFDRLHHSCQKHIGYTLDKKVHMIFIRSYFNKVDFVALTDFKTDIFESVFGLVGEHFASVLYRTDDVIEEDRFVVTFVDMFSHVFQYTISSIRPASQSPYPGASSEEFF